GHNCVTQQKQGSDLNDIFRGLRGHRDVKAAVIFSLLDTNDLDFGLATTTFQRKPAFDAVQSTFTKPLGKPRSVKLTVSGGTARGSAPAGDLIQLRAFKPGSGQFGYQQFIQLNRENRYSWRLPGAVRRGWEVLAIQPWTGRRTSVRVR